MGGEKTRRVVNVRGQKRHQHSMERVEMRRICPQRERDDAEHRNNKKNTLIADLHVFHSVGKTFIQHSVIDKNKYFPTRENLQFSSFFYKRARKTWRNSFKKALPTHIRIVLQNPISPNNWSNVFACSLRRAILGTYTFVTLTPASLWLLSLLYWSHKRERAWP